MEADQLLPSISIVIEWDNALQANQQNTRKMIDELRKQVIELEGLFEKTPEIIFVFDENKVSEKDFTAYMEELFGESFTSARLIYTATVGLRYYELKNRGAEKSTNELLVFLDSDVIPQAGWLYHLLIPFKEVKVRVVAGQCNFQLNNIVDKSFAMFWYFPLHENNKQLSETNILYANNFAIYRKLFAEIYFPETSYFRGQCVVFSEQLRRRGEIINLAYRACVLHPAPSNAAYFIRRALCEGHDYEIKENNYSNSSISPKTFRHWYYMKTLKIAFRAIINKYRDVDLGPGGAIVAMIIAWTYITLVASGKLVTRYYPEIIPHYFAI